MQGLWGFHNYVTAAVQVAPKRQLEEKLPFGKFRLTHEWDRFYDSAALVAEMGNVFEFVLCRTSLVGLVSIFEAAVERFIQRVMEQDKVQRVPNKYNAQLRWVFDCVKETGVGSPAILDRLPETCGDVDNARRLRNCIAHNNGKYDDSYYEDVIDDGWVKVRIEPDYDQYRRDRWMPIFLVTARFEYFSRSHIELLHILHNTIQAKFFGHLQGFHYGKERKSIEWHRVLSGKSSVGM